MTTSNPAEPLSRAASAKRYFMFGLAMAFVAADFMAFDTSIVPGLSVKNGILYILVIWTVLEIALDARRGGAFNRPIDYPALHLGFLGLIGFAVLSAVTCLLLSIYPGYNAAHAVFTLKSYLIDHYVMLFVFLMGLRNAADARWMLKGLLLSVAVGCVAALLDMFGLVPLDIMIPRGDGRLEGALGSNEYGALMAVCVPMGFAFLFLARGWARLLWAVATVVFIVVLFFSASRGAVLGLLVAAFVSAFLLRRYVKLADLARAAAAFILAAGLALAVLMANYSELLYERFIGSTFADDTFYLTSGRNEIWMDAWTIMWSEPWSLIVGQGWRSFEFFAGFAIHSEYFDAFFSLGLVGLSLFLLTRLSVVHYILRGISRADDQTRAVLMALLVGHLSFLVASIFGNRHQSWLYLWALIGLSLRMAAGSTQLAGELSGGRHTRGVAPMRRRKGAGVSGVEVGRVSASAAGANRR